MSSSKSSLFGNLKEDMQKELVSAAIEKIYATGKISGFKHPPDIEEQIEIMRQNREEIPVLREKVSGKLKREKDVAEAESQLSKDYIEMAEHPNQHPKLKSILEKVSELNSIMASNRFNMHAQVGIINEEWKKWETAALKDIRLRQDQLNHCWCEIKYWKHKTEHSKLAERESRYKVLTSEFVQLVHDVRRKKEVDIPTWLLCVVQYELEFFSKTVGEIARIEKDIRTMGPVQAMEIAGADKFQLTIGSEPQPLLLEAPFSSAPVGATHTPDHLFAASPVPPTSATSTPRGERGRPSARTTVPASQAPQTGNPFTSGAGGLVNPFKPAPLGRKASALFNFEAQGPGQISFQAGDILTITEENAGEGWVVGVNSSGEHGFVPSNYIETTQ